MRRPLTAAIIIAACALLAWQLAENSQVRTLLGDFRAFYCGGAALLHGESPYAAAPLLRCEQIPQPYGLHYRADAVDLPAPFPGYALAAFALLALLPYTAAAIVWFLLLLVCTVLSCVFLGRLCSRPPIVALALLAAGFSISVIPYGELAPVIMLGITGGALALRRGIGAGFIAALAAIALLPHVALPVFAALFIWKPAARWAIVGLGAGLAVLDLAVTGPSLALSYFTRVLPSHAASEIGFVTQYSMTWFAQGLGAPDRVALLAGNISYAVMVVAGVWLAGLLARKLTDPAFLVVIPAGFAVTFGSFIHYSEITLALPAALLLYTRTNGSARTLAAFAVALVALPWQSVVTQPALTFAFVAGVIAIAAITLALSGPIALRAGLAAALFCALCVLLAWHFGPQIAQHAGRASFDPALAEASWAKHISAETSSYGIVWWVPKLPTWIGLLLLAASAAVAARSPLRAKTT